MTICRRCGAPVAAAQPFCTACGARLDAPAALLAVPDPAPARTGWIRWTAILLLVFVWPLGIVFLWAAAAFTKRTRTAITAAFLAAALFGLVMLLLWTASPGYRY